ncbi:metal ABC transporter solute-binding protein, Zn/Mn family [Mycolicibacterium goodii]|uniref:Zinc ABC transporter substrate-binding protein n=1 Tax=Mycolicibacterium goodii TaxID=134601 RepID=A0ABS6HZJ1_MYCGD|nr:zinc ABC transporter substrate-binding protein [Mycolicibacterium goodii]MBU8826763.1 zinc ABC transporter substrate-binding protein [Mycolicibacterium goodii]MBU8832791.1 zinc ABC transporter substrate-binding protein [Mycolicibacterium goodii]MBU8837712.1 zinc ABC transporter substrate-binding protein [Mycolicibacterium goodii]
MQTVIVIDVISPLSVRTLAVSVALAAPFALAACGSDESSTAEPAGDCPTTPVNVVVSVDQWGDIVSELGGACAKVTTVLAGSSVDPHDFEPSPSDAAKFEGAQLVVINGGHYDEWAGKLARSSAPNAPVVAAVADAGAHEDDAHDHGHDEHGHAHAEEGVNPHAWYSPAAVTTVADEVTAKLGDLAPEAKDYFAGRRAAFTESMKPYNQLIDDIKAKASGKTYAATEAVFDDMAAAVGLTDRTPSGYQVASSNETDPSPADFDAFLTLLENRGVDVLIYNVQTEGSVPQQLRTAAESAGIPVVEVTETVAPDADSFEAWQVDQLTALAKALGVES